MTWRNRDLPECERATLLLADNDATRGRRDADVVELLNEPLPVLQRLALDVMLLDPRLPVAALVDEQRVALCRHGKSLIADDDTAMTGRATCASCNAVVVRVDNLPAIAHLVPGCALFRGPRVPVAEPRVTIGERLESKWPVTETVLARGVIVVDRVDDELFSVECVPGYRAMWWHERFGARADVEHLYAIARTSLLMPTVCDLYVMSDTPPRQPIKLTVNGAADFGVTVGWPSFTPNPRPLIVGSVIVASFDRHVTVHRTVNEVVVAGTGAFISVPNTGEMIDVPTTAINDPTVQWRGRDVRFHRLPPPAAGAVRLNLLVAAQRLQGASFRSGSD